MTEEIDQKKIDRLSSQLDDLKASIDSTRDALKATSEETVGLMGSFTKNAAEQAHIQERAMAAGKQLNRDLMQQAELELRIAKAKGEGLAAAEEEVANLKEANAKLDIQHNKIKAVAEATQQVDSLTGDIASKVLMGTSAWFDTALAIGKSYSNLAMANKEAGEFFFRTKAALTVMTKFAGSLWQAVHPIKIISSIISKVQIATIEFMWTFTEAVAGFSKSVGDAGEMHSAVAGAMELGAGVNIQQAAAAAADLATTLKSLTTASKENQKFMIRGAAQLAELGIGASETGANIEAMTRGMGMSGKQAMDTMHGMAASANAFGQTSAQYLGNWSKMMPSLMAHGKGAKKVFEGLAAQAKSAGLEMDVLYKVAKKYDTFDSAAQSVGNLNAILGGDYLNSLEMMNMTEEERIDAMKRAFEMTGKTFDQMERYERKAIAEQLGVQESELAQMMGIETREMRKAAKEAKRRERDEKLRRKMLTSTVSLMTKLQHLFQSLFVNNRLMKEFSKAFKLLFERTSNKTQFGKFLRSLIKDIGDLMALGFGKLRKGIEWLTSDENAGKLNKWYTGFKEGIGGVWKFVEPLIDLMWNLFKGFFGFVGSMLSTVFGPSLDNTKDKVVQTFDSIADYGKAFGAKVEEFLQPWRDFSKDMSKGIEDGKYTAGEAFGFLFKHLIETVGVLWTEFTAMMKSKLLEMLNSLVHFARSEATKKGGVIGALFGYGDFDISFNPFSEAGFGGIQVDDQEEAMNRMMAKEKELNEAAARGAEQRAHQAAESFKFIGSKIKEVAADMKSGEGVAEIGQQMGKDIANPIRDAFYDAGLLARSPPPFFQNMAVDGMKTTAKAMADNMGAFTEVFAEMESIGVRAIQAISQAIEDMPTDKTVEFKGILEATSKISSEQAKSTEKAFIAAAKYQKQVQKTMKEGKGNEELVAAIKNLSPVAAGGGEGGTYILEIDGQKFDAFLSKKFKAARNP